MLDRNWLAQLPKTDLHCHLDGSLRLSTLIELASEIGIACDAMVFGQIQPNLEHYLQAFDLTCQVMQTKTALQRIAYELTQDAARENVSHLEIRFAPHLMMQQGLTMQQVLSAVSQGMSDASQQYDISTGIILCAMRQFDPDKNLEVAKAVATYRHLGVVGLDFAGPETGSHVTDHLQCFEWAQQHGLNITIHAGEASDATSIEEAVFKGHAQRIGHGTHLMQNPALLKKVIQDQIPIEVCLSSNWQTGAVSDLRLHPAKALLEAGACITINTDNRLVSATTLTHELELAHDILGFSKDQIERVVFNGFKSVFKI